MTWVDALGVLGIFLAATLVVWYKLHSDTDAAVAQKAQSDAQASQVLAEKQLQEKAQQDKEQLNAQINSVLALPDQASRQRASLDLLARLRGTH